VKPTNRDLFELLVCIDRNLNTLIRQRNPDFSREDATVKAMTGQVKEAESELPPHEDASVATALAAVQAAEAQLPPPPGKPAA
jgi:hypothetical protein